MKTADEMFRTAGYHQTSDTFSDESLYRYENGNGWAIEMDDSGHINFLVGFNQFEVSPRTILACAQLIQEMEANHETD